MWPRAWWPGTCTWPPVLTGVGGDRGSPDTPATRLPSSLCGLHGRSARPVRHAPPVPRRPPHRGRSQCAPATSTQPSKPRASGRRQQRARRSLRDAQQGKARCPRRSVRRACAVRALWAWPKRSCKIGSPPPRSLGCGARRGWPHGPTHPHASRLLPHWHMAAHRGMSHWRIRQQDLDDGGTLHFHVSRDTERHENGQAIFKVTERASNGAVT